MAQVVRDATQLGAWRVTPVLCEFGVARPSAELSQGAWRHAAIAAVKQSGNVFIPRLDPPCSFERAVAEAGCVGYFGAVPRQDEIRGTAVAPQNGELALWIGPEGGFTSEEQDALRQCGCEPLTVGRWTLRVETAVPALLGALIGMLGNDNL